MRTILSTLASPFDRWWSVRFKRSMCIRLMLGNQVRYNDFITNTDGTAWRCLGRGWFIRVDSFYEIQKMNSERLRKMQKKAMDGNRYDKGGKAGDCGCCCGSSN